MIYTLQNDAVQVSLDTLGGTLSSIRSNGLEYLWQGDPAYWSSKAPICFPICGGLRDGHAFIGNGKDAFLNRHGCVRKREFQLEKQTNDTVTLSISSNEEMLKEFPYPFVLHAEYKLDKNKVRVTYHVENTGSEKMPFCIGGHPGFNVPLEKNEAFEDYELRFEEKETCDAPVVLAKSGLIDMNERIPFLDNQDSIRLSHDFFNVDAKLLDNLKTRKVTLISTKSGHGVSVAFDDFPYLNVWSSSNKGPFVALEPWCGISTAADEDDVFENKRHVQFAEPGETKSYSFTISLL
ncbi:MAG: aldose 1-epimerase family protein [Eubacterium sp.]|nr:aldose 1-epimerase family protein [Eubacterium sp.]